MDAVTWGTFALTLTLLGGIGTWVAFRRRGPRAGTRWLAATLLVPAAYFTRTLKMLGRIADAVVDWAASFVWNPMVWFGIVLAGISVALLVASRWLPSRRPAKAAAPAKARRGELPETRSGGPAIDGDDDLADIEAILKRRGIS